jgi:hypothetical protein
MEWGFLIPVVAIAVGPIAWVANNWIRAKHGYPLEDADEGTSSKQAKALTRENERLTGEVAQLHQRIAVLERIVTDPAERTAREIEKLR